MSTYPSQEHFNEEHDEPREYGEGDYIVIGTQYDEHTALKKLIAAIESWTGKPAAEYYDLDSLSKYSIGTGIDEDKEPCYVTNPKEGNDRFEAWGLVQ